MLEYPTSFSITSNNQLVNDAMWVFIKITSTYRFTLQVSFKLPQPHILSKLFILRETSKCRSARQPEVDAAVLTSPWSWARRFKFPSSWSRDGTSGLSVVMTQPWQQTLKVEWMASLKKKLSSLKGRQSSLKCTVILDIQTVSTWKIRTIPKYCSFV